MWKTSLNNWKEAIPTSTPVHCSKLVSCMLQALFGQLTTDVVILTVLYSLAGLGIAIVNDFKSIEGDR